MVERIQREKLVPTSKSTNETINSNSNYNNKHSFIEKTFQQLADLIKTIRLSQSIHDEFCLLLNFTIVKVNSIFKVYGREEDIDQVYSSTNFKTYGLNDSSNIVKKLISIMIGWHVTLSSLETSCMDNEDELRLLEIVEEELKIVNFSQVPLEQQCLASLYFMSLGDLSARKYQHWKENSNMVQIRIDYLKFIEYDMNSEKNNDPNEQIYYIYSNLYKTLKISNLSEIPKSMTVELAVLLYELSVNPGFTDMENKLLSLSCSDHSGAVFTTVRRLIKRDIKQLEEGIRMKISEKQMQSDLRLRVGSDLRVLSLKILSGIRKLTSKPEERTLLFSKQLLFLIDWMNYLPLFNPPLESTEQVLACIRNIVSLTYIDPDDESCHLKCNFETDSLEKHTERLENPEIMNRLLSTLFLQHYTSRKMILEIVKIILSVSKTIHHREQLFDTILHLFGRVERSNASNELFGQVIQLLNSKEEISDYTRFISTLLIEAFDLQHDYADFYVKLDSVNFLIKIRPEIIELDKAVFLPKVTNVFNELTTIVPFQFLKILDGCSLIALRITDWEPSREFCNTLVCLVGRLTKILDRELGNSLIGESYMIGLPHFFELILNVFLNGDTEFKTNMLLPLVEYCSHKENLFREDASRLLRSVFVNILQTMENSTIEISKIRTLLPQLIARCNTKSPEPFMTTLLIIYPYFAEELCDLYRDQLRCLFEFICRYAKVGEECRNELIMSVFQLVEDLLEREPTVWMFMDFENLTIFCDKMGFAGVECPDKLLNSKCFNYAKIVYEKAWIDYVDYFARGD